MKTDERSLTTFRLHLIITCATTTLAFVAIIALSLFLPLASHLDRQDIAAAVSSGIAEHFLYLHTAFWPVALCSLVSCVAAAMLLYGKMTGPLARFVDCFKKIESGGVPNPIEIRATDYISNESDALNSMIEALREREQERADSLDELNQVTEEILARCADDADVVELVSKLRNLKGLS